jgi:hypothetical protein
VTGLRTRKSRPIAKLRLHVRFALMSGGKADIPQVALVPNSGMIRPKATRCRVGPAAPEQDLIRVMAWRGFMPRSRIARCEVRYNREKVVLVEIGYSLGHQRAPFSRSGTVLEVIELPKHIAR